jgi:hypothetical protein
LKGDFFTTDFKYVKIALKKCSGGAPAGCKNDYEALNFIRKYKLKIIYKDSNTD